MAYFTLAGDPQLSGSRLSWSGVLDPGSMQMISAGSTVDTVDCWRMTSDDAAGLSTHSEMAGQLEVPLPQDVMPGDVYSNHCDLDLRDGYYHVVLTVDAHNNGPGYELHVRMTNGWGELQSYHQTI